MGYSKSLKSFLTMDLDEMHQLSFLKGILKRQETNKYYKGYEWKYMRLVQYVH